MQRQSRTLFILLICALAPHGCATSHGPFADLRQGSSVRVVSEIDIQGFADSVIVRTAQSTFAVRANGTAPHIPARAIATELLSYADQQAVDDDSVDYTLRISAKGRGLQHQYTPFDGRSGSFYGDAGDRAPKTYAGKRVFTIPAGLFVQGTVAIERNGATVRTLNFTGQLRPPADLALDITHSSYADAPLFLEYAKPSGRAVCDRPGSLTQRAVELLGDLFGVPFLLATIRTASAPTREFAVTALDKAEIGGADEDLLVSALVADPDWRMRLLAARALGVRQRALPALVGALQDGEWRVRRQVAESLMGTKGSLTALTSAAEDPEWRVRQQAIESLEPLKDRRVTESLLTALRDEEWRVRLLAAQSLGNRGDKRAGAALIAALQDREYGVRYHTIVALEKLKERRAVRPLVQMLIATEGPFQRRIARAIEKIAGSHLGADPAEWEAWWTRNETRYP